MLFPDNDFNVPPDYAPVPGFMAEGCNAIMYDGPAWQGKPTRVFAWYGVPTGKLAGEKVPAIILVHGGGGTAFAEWVRLWTNRGYAAIAMDLCGCLPRARNGELGVSYNMWERHPDGGPAGWGGVDQMELPLTDNWVAQAVTNIVRAHTLLRSFPEIDTAHIGITGISWGGYLTCIAAGLDNRFAYAVPVYGCGFLHEDSSFAGNIANIGAEKAASWIANFEPSVYLPQAEMPILWVTGTNDFAFPLSKVQKSYRLPGGPRTLAIRVRMPHGHGGAGENPEEIRAFADSFSFDKAPLPQITAQGRMEDTIWATYESQTTIVSAELNYTTDTGNWEQREWHTVPAMLDTVGHRVSASCSPTATAYLNLIDDRALLVSSEHSEGV